MSNFIPLEPIKEKKLTPQEYLNLSSEEKANILSSRIIPPSSDHTGAWNFGYISVELKNPIYTYKHG